jgi:hypothetical protein
MLEQVDSCTYFGTVTSQDGRIDQEVANRVQKANNAYFQINNIFGKRELEMKTKTHILSVGNSSNLVVWKWKLDKTR